jgi:hypothetical protein
MINLARVFVAAALAGAILIAIMFFGSRLVEAQHGPGHVACDVKWLETGKPAAEYEKFMDDCLAATAPEGEKEQEPYEGEEEQAPYKSGEEQWVHPDSRLSVTVFNSTGRQVTMKIYSQNRRGKVWGPYELPYEGNYTYNKKWPPNLVIDCKMDEYVCMGAWDSSGMTWGLGDGERRCDNCCVRCNGRGHSWDMTKSGFSYFLR